MLEQQAGFIMSTNAIMVVLLQVPVTRWSSQRPHLRVLALGALIYALGVGSVALGAGFWAFWLSMVVLTFGELLIAPTGTAYAANAAPPDMRGRYMGLYGLTWGVAFGIGPVLGGWLNDNVSPVRNLDRRHADRSGCGGSDSWSCKCGAADAGAPSASPEVGSARFNNGTLTACNRFTRYPNRRSLAGRAGRRRASCSGTSASSRPSPSTWRGG